MQKLTTTRLRQDPHNEARINFEERPAVAVHIQFPEAYVVINKGRVLSSAMGQR